MSDENNDYLLRWGDTFGNNLSNGISTLQKKQEFVDVTLATGGHLVGAHQIVLAQASPYFKEILKSIPCRHPVIFLGPINQTVLAFILEFIYTGEVRVPSSVVPAFVEACKLLHITGVKEIEVPEKLVDFIPSLPRKNTMSFQRILRPINLNEEAIDENGQGNEQSFEKKEINQSQTMCGSNAVVPIEIFNQSGANHRSTKTINTVAHVTINEANQVFVQPLLMDEIQSSQFSVAEPNLTISNEVSCANIDDIKWVFNRHGSTDFAEGVKIESINCDRSLQPIVNNTVEHQINAMGDYESDLNKDESETHDEDYEMEINFENLIKDNIIRINPQINTKTLPVTNQTDIVQIIGNDESLEKEEFKVDVATESGLLTISHVPNSSNDSEGETNKEYEKILGTITNTLYTHSTRGSLQMILNRYIYYSHYSTSSKRRWRCIDYRKNHCPAFVDTHNEDILSRKHHHNHSYHDAKIIKLGRTRELYTSMKAADKKFTKSN